MGKFSLKAKRLPAEGDTGRIPAVPAPREEVQPAKYRIFADVVGSMTMLTCSYTVSNSDEKTAIEIDAELPMIKDASLCGLLAKMGGRTVVGVVKGSEAAADEYDDSIASGR